MKTQIQHSTRGWLATIKITLSLPVLLAAQVASPPAKPAVPAGGTRVDEAVVLSPFEVISARDYGYTATNTLAGGRLNTSLRETPASISVLTREFLDDIGGGDFRTALQYATNAIPVSDTDTPTVAIGTTRAGGVQAETSPTSVRVRGFAEARATRNYFVWGINSDNYNTERIDMARGPNTLIFGDAGSGGVANITTKQARFAPIQSLSVRYLSYGGGRATVDFNRPLNQRLALRLNAIHAREDGWRDDERYERDGLSATMTWKVSDRTQVRADAEWGYTKNFAVQTVTRDNISAWNGTFVFSTPNLTPPTGSGAVRFDSATQVDYLVYTAGSEAQGLVNWRGFGRTNGSDASLETRLSPSAPAGVTPFLLTNSAVATLGRQYFGILPNRRFNVTPGNRYFITDFYAMSATVDHKFGRNLFVEAGYARQQDYRKQNTTGATNSIYLDINAVLPSGAPNPNFLRPFMDFVNNREEHFTGQYDELRASGVYQLKTGLTDQKLGLFASRRTNAGTTRIFYPRRVNNAASPSVNNNANIPVHRTYLAQRKYPVPATTLGGDFGGIQIRVVETNGGSETDTTSDTVQGFASGAWLKSRRLKTLVGLRRDTSDRSIMDPTIDPVTSLFTGYMPGSERSVGQTSFSGGASFDLLPTLTAYANYSESFLADSGGVLTLDNQFNEPRHGSGKEAGLKFEFLGGRVSGSASYYDQTEANNVVRVLSANNSDMVGVNTTSLGVSLNAIGAALGRPIFSGNRTTVPNYNDTQNVHAKGFEFDVAANLTPGWALLGNIAFPQIEQTNALADTKAFVAANRTAWTTAANALGATVAATVSSRLATIDGQLGQFPDGRKSNGVVQYTANLFTRYRFAQGALKGFSVGGGVNLRGRRIAGVQSDGSVIYANGHPVLNAVVGYATRWRGIAVNLQLNAANLLDEAYQRYSAYYTVNGVVLPYIYTQQPPRRLQLSATLGF